MPTPEKLIADLEDTIAEALDRFNGRLPKVEQDMYARILELSADLETDKGGRIKPSMTTYPRTFLYRAMPTKTPCLEVRPKKD